MAYDVLNVLPDTVFGDEQLGSQKKFWFVRDGERWLFKEARDRTGEHWAEKIAGEVSSLLGIDAARIELASFRGRAGSASLSFIARDSQSLVHGNEILAGQILGYDRDKKLKQTDHTLENIIRAIENLSDGDAAFRDTVLEQLASYLVLDALIGNTDRHHENWGLLEERGMERPQRIADRLRVAPSFDHASSLGRELGDERREAVLRLGKSAERSRGNLSRQRR